MDIPVLEAGLEPKRGILTVTRNVSVPMTRRDIMEFIPYGDEFLFVDLVTDIIKGEKNIWWIEAETQISAGHCRGHFRDYSVVPGNLIKESLEQAGGVLLAWLVKRNEINITDERQGFLVETNKIKHKKMVSPGELIKLKARLEKFHDPLAIFSGEAFVNDRKVMSINEWKIFLVKK